MINHLISQNKRKKTIKGLNENLKRASEQPTQLQLKTCKGNLRRLIFMGHKLRVPTGQCKAILEIF